MRQGQLNEIDARVRQGHRDAFGALFDQEADGLFRSIQSQGNTCLTAEDIDEIISDAFRALLVRVRKGVAGDFKPRWYLRWIAHRRVISRIRAADGPKSAVQRTSSVDPIDPLDPDAETPDHRLLTEERVSALDAAMMTLSDRESCSVDWWKNHDPPDWALFEATTGIPAKAGRKLFTSAKAKLKNALAESIEQDELKGGAANDKRKRQTA